MSYFALRPFGNTLTSAITLLDETTSPIALSVGSYEVGRANISWQGTPTIVSGKPDALAVGQVAITNLNQPGGKTVQLTIGAAPFDGLSPILGIRYQENSGTGFGAVHQIDLAAPEHLLGSRQIILEQSAATVIRVWVFNTNGDGATLDLAAVTPTAPSLDYTVTTPAEAAAVFALGGATLSGKTMAISGTGITKLDIPAGIHCTAPFRITSLNAGSSVAVVDHKGSLTNVILDGLQVIWKPSVMGWGTSTYLGPLIFASGDFIDYQMKNCLFKALYGLADEEWRTDFEGYPEYSRIRHDLTVTTTSQTFPATFPDPGKGFGWFEVFNTGSAAIYYKCNDNPVDTATTADTMLAAGQRANTRPGKSDYIHVLGAGATTATFRAEQGMGNYMPRGFNTQTGTNFHRFVYTGNHAEGFADFWKTNAKFHGATIHDRCTARAIYQDYISGNSPGDANSRFYFTRSLVPDCFSRTGVNLDLTGDPQDAHGDPFQFFSGAHPIRVTVAGITSANEKLRLRAGPQSWFFGDNPPTEYSECFFVGNIGFLAVANAITLASNTGAGGQTGNNYIYGNTMLNRAFPIHTAGEGHGKISVADQGGKHSYVARNFANAITNNSNNIREGNFLATKATVPGVITDVLPNWTSLTTATDQAGIENALVTAGAALGTGAVAVRAEGLIDWITDDATKALRTELLPAGVGWHKIYDNALGAVVSYPSKRILAGPLSQAVSVPAGVEYKICSDAAGTIILQNWTSVPGTIQPGQYIELRGTVPNTYAADGSFSVTINGKTYTAPYSTVEDTALTFNVVGAGPSFVDTAGSFPVSGVTQKLCGRYKIRMNAMPASGSVMVLHSIGSARNFEVASTTGAMRLTFRDSASNVFGTYSMPDGTLQVGKWAEIFWSVDLTNSAQGSTLVKVWVNGDLILDVDDTKIGTGLFSTSKLYLLQASNAVSRPNATIRSMKVWRDVALLAPVEPAQAPYNQEITGPSAIANSHPWKTAASADAV